MGIMYFKCLEDKSDIYKGKIITAVYDYSYESKDLDRHIKLTDYDSKTINTKPLDSKYENHGEPINSMLTDYEYVLYDKAARALLQRMQKGDIMMGEFVEEI